MHTVSITLQIFLFIPIHPVLSFPVPGKALPSPGFPCFYHTIFGKRAASSSAETHFFVPEMYLRWASEAVQ